MTLWFVFALMTVAAIFAVLLPLGRATRSPREGRDITVYKDQLTEIDRDAETGLIGGAEAAAARVEIGRRLLAAADSERAAPTVSSRTPRRLVAILALVGLPVLALAFYLPLGSPRLEDYPLAERQQTATSAEPLDQLVGQVEAHLEKNPTDGRGWTVLAPVLSKIGRYDDAARAYRNSITYGGDSAARRADLGEALTGAANGVVTAEAKTEFEHAVALNSDDAKARYFLGLAAEQDGRVTAAADIWRTMLAKAPADAPWRPIVQSALTRVDASAPAPSAEPSPGPSTQDVAAASGMNEADRSAMIHGMVDKLAARLKQDGGDVEGWLRLIRAYVVLGERGKASAAQSDARQAVGSDAERLRQLNQGLKSLGLDG